ncbi:MULTISPECIES: RNase RNM [Pasteurellaceae]|uniref:RNase RNM n=1 Tax=Pasteurellaceae TaxID=712 RepID=UPI0035613159
MARIYDLHCHSNASDGVLTPRQVVLRAVEQGVAVLALTDHDTTAGLAPARAQAALSGLELISGVEISTVWENRVIHIVGLHFDETHAKMTALLAEQAEKRYQRAVEIGNKLAKAGVADAFAQAQKLTDGEVTRAHYARYLVQIGKVANEGQAFKRYLGQGKSAYVKAQWASIPEAVTVIHQAGGLAVLAHPLRYTLTAKWIKKLIAEFKQWGGDGIETAGCGQRDDQRQLLARWATEYGLQSSVGSDFHYPCSWVDLGRSLQLPAECTPIWQSWEK